MMLNIKHKIAIVTPYGAEPRLENYAEFLLAQGLLKRDYEVKFFTYKISNNPHYQNSRQFYQGVEVCRCRQYLGFSPGLCYEIWRWRPYILVAFHPRNFLGFCTALMAKIIRAKYIYEIVGILHDPFIASDGNHPIDTVMYQSVLLKNFTLFFKSLFKSGSLKEKWLNFIFHAPPAWADKLVAISADEQKYINHFYNKDSVLIPWSLPKDAMKTKERPINFPINFDNYLFFIGQIKKRKGWDTVLDSLSILKHEFGIIKNLVFTAPLINVDEAKEYARQLKIEDQIFFLTNVSNAEKNWLYCHSVGVLVPSRYEGFGLPVLEAFLADKPLLATDIPVFLEFLTHKKNALISKVGDAKSLAKNIIELENDPELARELVSAGRVTASRYTDDIMIEKFIKLFDDLLSEKLA